MTVWSELARDAGGIALFVIWLVLPLMYVVVLGRRYVRLAREAAQEATWANEEIQDVLEDLQDATEVDEDDQPTVPTGPRGRRLGTSAERGTRTRRQAQAQPHRGGTVHEIAPAALLVRLRRGVVGERERTCHLVPVPSGDAVPSSLVAYCGLVILPGTVDLLSAPEGMPCVDCLFRSPLPPAPIKEIQ